MFTSIKKISNGIDALMLCNDDNGSSFERWTFQIINGRLHAKTIVAKETTPDKDASGCVQVKTTPNGYLNLREGPGMAFKVKAKLVYTTMLRVDVKNDEWTHVAGVVEGSWVETDGWVY